ncbi:IS200/IS605 family transposase [Candidatus Tisiphia endosymbiont of Temnostethus pusillus]|uniref:IS200/IS605 family transposase n=1 Tax=unclassified Candidatus Tisiphia TaxID=2996318 RepID=UPI0035C8F14E
MPNYNSLNHCTWECKYHVVFTPKYRKKTIFGLIRKELKEVFHRLAGQKECKIEEGYLMQDHEVMISCGMMKKICIRMTSEYKSKNLDH